VQLRKKKFFLKQKFSLFMAISLVFCNFAATKKTVNQ